MILNIFLGSNPEEHFLDETVASYVQFLYSNTPPKYQGNLIFAAILDCFPRARLAVVRRCLKAWDRVEPATSAFPVPCLYLLLILHTILYICDLFQPSQTGVAHMVWHTRCASLSVKGLVQR